MAVGMECVWEFKSNAQGYGSPGNQHPESKRTTSCTPCGKFLAMPLYAAKFTFSEANLPLIAGHWSFTSLWSISYIMYGKIKNSVLSRLYDIVVIVVLFWILSLFSCSFQCFSVLKHVIIFSSFVVSTVTDSRYCSWRHLDVKRMLKRIHWRSECLCAFAHFDMLNRSAW